MKNQEAKNKLTKKQLMMIIIPIVVVAVLVAVIVPSVVVSNNIFRVGKVNKINIGDDQERVIKILGEPYEKSDYRYEYYSSDYVKLAKQIDEYYNSDFDFDEDILDKDIEDFDPDKDLDWDDDDKITKMEEQLDNMIYKYIQVDFDNEKKVQSVFLDMEKCDSKEYRKVVKSYEVLDKEIEIHLFDTKTLNYAVKYTDKSFYKGLAVKDYDFKSIEGSKIEWKDTYGNVFTKSYSASEILSPIVCSNEYIKMLVGEDLTELTEFEIPNGIEEISNDAFNGCVNLKKITIPSSLKDMKINMAVAFADCSKLESIIVDKDNEYFESNGNCLMRKFAGMPVYQVVLGCYNSIIPNNATEILDYAFYGRTGLTSIEIPDGVKGIEKFAFGNCRDLTSIVIPNSVKIIESEAFYNCSNLTFYCEAEKSPNGWGIPNNSTSTIVWGYKR